MRGLHPVLLVVLLCSELAPALSLRCHLCSGTQEAQSCLVMTCGPRDTVCYRANLVTTWTAGQKIESTTSACGPSCEEATKQIEALANQTQRPGSPGPKMEVKGVSCCERDLCNAAAPAERGLWALAGGVLLSLGPALLSLL
ncbi:lymphocyte antigen 6H-like [Pteronotus mesoamericanus]|uniref:lymphocyte antigen 6H-like n=1 Tax=Pteronotus mesoamericanus TaxID=1884717 RepID=UPI0023EB685D|nr:lymphocyte antigen 6H-like [Pteronotus parnellii mesoamericanus]